MNSLKHFRPLYNVENQDKLVSLGYWEEDISTENCGSMDLNAVNEFASGKAKGTPELETGQWARVDG